MNIDVVRIKNFRNYLGEHEFILNKTITILYGSNGFGKSSFFDAIEWCLTGGISRYDKSFDRKSVINHSCNFENAECCVEIFFGGNILSRSFKIMNNEFKRESVKITTKSGDIIRYKENVDNFLKHTYAGSENNDLFGSLIKQSHILSQDQVTDFISKDDPKDRFNSLADIMGLKNVLYMYENFKEIRNEVQNTKIKHEEMKKQNHDNMQLRSKDLIPVGAELLDEIESLIHQLPSVETLEEVLPKIEQNKLSLRQSINQAKESIKNIEQKGFSSVLMAKERANSLRGEIRSAEDLVGKLKQLNSRIQILRKNIAQKTDLMKEVTGLNNEINEKTTTLIDLGFIESTGISEVAELALPKRDRLSKLIYAISSKMQYQMLLQEAKSSSKIPVLKNKEARLLNKVLRLNGLIEHILTLLNDSEDGAIAKLLQDIQNIHNYIQHHDTEGKCPVCSAHHGDKLQSEVARNINVYELRVNEKTSKANKLMSIKARFEKRKNEIDKDLKQTKNELSGLQLSIDNALQQLETIKSNSLYEYELFDVRSLEEINAENERVKNDITQFDVAITAIEIIIQLKNKRTTKLGELGTQFVGDLSKEAIGNRKRRLERAESRVINYINNKKNKIKNLQEEYDDLFAVILKLPEDYKERDNQTPIVDILTSYGTEAAKVETELMLLSKASELKRTLQFNGKVSSDIEIFLAEQQRIEEQLRRCNDVIYSSQTFIDNIGRVLGTKAKDFLNTSQSLIQKYYRYLNPMPSNNVIKFDGDNGELNILVPLQDDTQFSNVKHTLSSGQLNVLAIAIFLAINESQKISQLDFVAIDDPIQNMDDVNRFAICDVLGSLKKQLILSTHDLDFVKLFIKKNEHISSEIQLYILESQQLKSGKIKRMDFVTEGTG
jgi:exonuclease SbcC